MLNVMCFIDVNIVMKFTEDVYKTNMFMCTKCRKYRTSQYRVRGSKAFLKFSLLLVVITEANFTYTYKVNY